MKIMGVISVLIERVGSEVCKFCLSQEETSSHFSKSKDSKKIASNGKFIRLMP